MIFGSKKKVYVFAGNQPMFVEDNAFTFNDNIIFKSLWYEEDAVDHIRDTIFNGDYMNYRQFYKYGKKHYTRGLPAISFVPKELISQLEIIKNVWEDYCNRFGLSYSEADFPKDLIWERMPFELVDWASVSGNDRPPITENHLGYHLAARLLIDDNITFNPLTRTIKFSDTAMTTTWLKEDEAIEHPLRGQEWYLELDTAAEIRTEELMIDMYQLPKTTIDYKPDPEDPLGPPLENERPLTEKEKDEAWEKHKPVLRSAGYVTLIGARISNRHTYSTTYPPMVRYISELDYPIDPNAPIDEAGNDEDADEFNRDDLFIQIRVGKNQTVYVNDEAYTEDMSDSRLPKYGILLPPPGQEIVIRVEGENILEDQEYQWTINSEGVISDKQIGIPEGIPLSDLEWIDPIDEDGNILVGAACRPTGAEIVNFRFFPLRQKDILDINNPTQDLWYPIQMTSSEIPAMLYQPSNTTEYPEDYRKTFPVAILRESGGWLVRNKGNPHYKSTKKMLSKLQFNMDKLSNNILNAEGFSDTDLQTAAMVPSVDIRTNNQCCMRYLYELYDFMRNNQRYHGTLEEPDPRAYESHLWNLNYPDNHLMAFLPEGFEGNAIDYLLNGDTAGWAPDSEIYILPSALRRPLVNEMKVDQWPYNARYTWGAITFKPNVKQPIKRKRNYYERKNLAIYRHNGDGTANIIDIGGLNVSYFVQIHTGRGDTAGLDGESDFSLPLIYGVLKELPPLQQEEVVARGMYATMFSGKVVKVKRWKKYLGFIVAIVITIVTWGYGAPAGAAIGGGIAGGITAAVVVNIVINMVIKFVIGRIISFVIAKIIAALDLGFLGVVLEVIANMVASYFMGGAQGSFLTADTIISGVTQLSNGVNAEMQKRMQELTLKTNEEIAGINSATKEVEQLIADYNKGISNMKMQQFILESPKMFEARTELDTTEAALYLDDGEDLKLYGLDYGFE